MRRNSGSRFGNGMVWNRANKPDRVSPNVGYGTDTRIGAKLKRCGNHAARYPARDRVNFQTHYGNIFGLWSDDVRCNARYVLYSWGKHYPMFAYSETLETWFGVSSDDASSASVSTSQHWGQVRPDKFITLTERDMSLLAEAGEFTLVASKMDLSGVHPEDQEQAVLTMMTTPRLPEMLRAKGSPADLDVGMGAKLEAQAHHACEALGHLGMTPLMLGGWMPHDARATHPYSRTRFLTRLDKPCNAHREILFGGGWVPTLGTKAGRPVIKFYSPVQESTGKEPLFRPVWIEFASRAEAKAGLRTLNAMRQLNMFGSL